MSSIQLFIWLGFLLGSIFLFWTLYQISKRIIAKGNPNLHSQAKRIAFTIIALPITWFILYGLSVIALLSFIFVEDLAVSTYSKKFLAGTCYPAIYPSGEFPEPEHPQIVSYTVQESPDVVASFFENQLNSLPLNDSTLFTNDVWLLSEDNASTQTEYVFSCESRYGNNYYEAGCIYVKPTDGGSLIESNWNLRHSETVYWCIQ
jgi:hypothetical protein